MEAESMNDEQGYNGWSNRETWLMALWIDNDESAHSYRQELVAAEVGYSADNQEPGDTFTLAENTRANVARALEAWQDECMESFEGDSAASVFTDLLHTAYGAVDWYEIAENYLSELVDQ